MKIKTNNIPRQLLDWSQLTPNAQDGFHYMNHPEEVDFFRYQGRFYSLAEAMVAPYALQPYWDGVYNDTAFSGVVVKLCDDPDYVVVGRFSC